MDNKYILNSSRKWRLKETYYFFEQSFFDDLKAWDGTPQNALCFGCRTAEDVWAHFQEHGKGVSLKTIRGYIQEEHYIQKTGTDKEGKKEFYAIYRRPKHRKEIQKREKELWSEESGEHVLKAILRRHNLLFQKSPVVTIPVETLETLMRRSGLL
jgi:hypothetical protein